jgi:hypothetical protein
MQAKGAPAPMLSGILSKLARSPERISDAGSTGRFLSARASFVSQKCVTEFCRVRTGVYWEKLFREAQFQDALMRSNWMAFTPALAMLTEMVEGVLRPSETTEAQRLRQALGRLAGDIRTEMAPPAQVDRGEWDAQAGLVAERLDQAGLAPPRPVRMLADPLAKAVFDVLPLHVSLLKNDFDYIFNNLRMNVLAAHTAFVDTADPEAIVRDLLR